MFKYFKKTNNKMLYFFFLLFAFAFFVIPINSFLLNNNYMNQINNNFIESGELISVFSSEPHLYIDKNNNFLLSEKKIKDITEIEYGPSKDTRLFICLLKNTSIVPKFDQGIWFELDSSQYKQYCLKNAGKYTLFGHIYSSDPNIKGTLSEKPNKKSFDAPPIRIKTDISYDDKYSKLSNDTNIYSLIPSLASDLDEYGNRVHPTEDQLMNLKLVGGSGSAYWYQTWNRKGESDTPYGNLKAESESMRFSLGKEPIVISEPWVSKNLWNLCTMIRMYGVRVNNDKLIKQAESIISTYNLTANNPWGDVKQSKYQNKFEIFLKSFTGK